MSGIERIYTNKPSLQNLSYALRHREMWPKTFKWDYRSGNTCAIGLAAQLWGNADILYNLPEKDFARISRNYIGMVYGRSPEKVADSIDAYLARKG